MERELQFEIMFTIPYSSTVGSKFQAMCRDEQRSGRPVCVTDLVMCQIEKLMDEDRQLTLLEQERRNAQQTHQVMSTLCTSCHSLHRDGHIALYTNIIN
ncbi:hypothetical protein TNCT_641961 [Trichonephila clavata]|uniref:Uncharacterized protein n=1 Tax=Trichonephila clavata TaxID=2740835 RepID=A0A8X6LZN5_TRICU|nr:hypothetical protein TNCT_641961 [Trichonephila clavata]